MNIDPIEALTAVFGEPQQIAEGITAFGIQSEPRCFRIVRFYHPTINRRPRTIKTGLTEAEAQAHCERDDTSKKGVYFDGYDYMKGCKP